MFCGTSFKPALLMFFSFFIAFRIVAIETVFMSNSSFSSETKDGKDKQPDRRDKRGISKINLLIIFLLSGATR